MKMPVAKLSSVALLLALAGYQLAAHSAEPVAAAASAVALPDISGSWLIHSSVGTDGPQIGVHCTLVQDGAALSGTCTPEMENPEASTLTGSVTPTTARWGYDVVFNGNAGRVDFVATSVAADALAGTLSLSGAEAPFTAEKE